MKTRVLIALVLTLVLLASGTAYAAGPTDKATGSIEYYQPGYFFNFNAHAESDGHSAKGEAWNYTPAGGWYHAEVRCVNVLDNETVLFAAELVETNMASWGPWVLIKVHDGDTPGSLGDHIWGQFMSGTAANTNCNAGVTPAGGPWAVLSGNLVVHTY